MGSEQVVVERAETPVMFKRVADEVNEIGRGMQEIEDAVGLRGRKYYGAFVTPSSPWPTSSAHRHRSARKDTSRAGAPIPWQSQMRAPGAQATSPNPPAAASQDPPLSTPRPYFQRTVC